MKKRILITMFCVTLIPFFNSCKGTKKKVEGEEIKLGKVVEENGSTAEEVAINTLTQAEKDDGWVLLFDGKTSKGWRGYNEDHFPNGWQIVDGAIMFLGSEGKKNESLEGGDIIYNKKFKNFTLRLDWKISEGGNSGIFYLGQEDLENISRTAPEMQVLDNEKHPDAKKGKDGNRQAGSLYDLIPAKPQNAKPVGEWNQVEITVDNGTVVHIQNGEIVVEYKLGTPEWNELVAGSKFPGLNENWANVANEGYIGVQDHGDDVWFRNIKIKQL